MLLCFYLMLKAYSTLDFAMHLYKVHFTMTSTYRTIHHDDDDLQSLGTEKEEYGDNHGSETRSRSQWDDDCPWSEWYSAEDPVKGKLLWLIIVLVPWLINNIS